MDKCDRSRVDAFRTILPQPAFRVAGRIGRTTLSSLLAMPMLLPYLAIGDVIARTNPAQVEAAYLRNFAHYVGWPTHAFASERTPWRICVLGNDHFGDTLEETLRDRTEQGRPFVVVRTGSTADVASCQIAYLAFQSSEGRRAALAELSNRPVLTVSDAPEFLQEGGVIRFRITDRIEFAVNLDRANSASLKIPVKVLEVAQEVVENGVIRTRR